MIKWSLEISANVASIATAIVALYAYGCYRCRLRRKRIRLEQYLKSEKEKKTDKGQRTVLHLSATLALTDSDILQAAFESKNIVPKV